MLPAAAIIVEVHAGLVSAATPCPPLSALLARTRLVVPMRRGAVLFVADAEDPRVWWILAWGPGGLPGRDKLRQMIVLAKMGGCGWLAADTNESSAGIMAKLGFQHLGDGRYSLRLYD